MSGDTALTIAIEAKSMGDILAERFDRHLDKQDHVNEKLFEKIDELKASIVHARFEAKDADTKTNLKMYGIFSAISAGIYGIGEGIRHLFK